jgi:tetratricopeptide (TPR) repeat protein
VVKFVNKWLISLVCLLFYNSIIAQEDGVKEPVDTVPEYVKLYNKACVLIDTAKYNDALPMLKKVLKDNPDYYMAHNKMALIFIKQKKYKEVVKSLEKAEKTSPMNYETWKLKGINFFLQDNFKQSKIAIDSAVGFANDDKIDDTELLYYQAMLMYKGKSYKNAINVCVAILELKPKYVEVLVLKADCRFALKDWNNAVSDYDEALKAMPAEKPDYNCYRQKGKAKIELKDYKGALKDWSVILDNNAKDEEALISRGVCKINLNDNTGAIVDLDEAIKINSGNPVSYCNRGVAKSGNKIYVEALKDLDYAIKLKFDYAAAFVNRAAVKMASKDKVGACADLEKADRLGDNMAYKLIERYCKGK